MTFSVNMSQVPADYPRGKAGAGGWFCRFCGDPINKDDDIHKPVDIWICTKCFNAGNHTTSQARTQANRPHGSASQQTGTKPPPPPPSQKQQTQSQWDQFWSKTKASQSTTSGASAGPQMGRGTPPPPPAPSQSSDLEAVTDANWIEIIFEVIPDQHVKRVYKSLARTYHPDIGGTQEEITRINGAYQKRMAEST